MPRTKTLGETYDFCLAYGEIKEDGELNTQRIRDLENNAETCISAASILMKALVKDNKEWMNVYLAYYEALRMYTEAFLSTDQLKISNHQCLFAALCIKHPELELDWSFFEKIRTKRNGANYYGEQIAFKDWKAIEVQIKLYISTIKREVEKKLCLPK